MCVTLAATTTTPVMLTHWDPMDKKSPWDSKKDWRQRPLSFSRGTLQKSDSASQYKLCSRKSIVT